MKNLNTPQSRTRKGAKMLLALLTVSSLMLPTSSKAFVSIGVGIAMPGMMGMGMPGMMGMGMPGMMGMGMPGMMGMGMPGMMGMGMPGMMGMGMPGMMGMGMPGMMGMGMPGMMGMGMPGMMGMGMPGMMGMGMPGMMGMGMPGFFGPRFAANINLFPGAFGFGGGAVVGGAVAAPVANQVYLPNQRSAPAARPESYSRRPLVDKDGDSEARSTCVDCYRRRTANRSTGLDPIPVASITPPKFKQVEAEEEVEVARGGSRDAVPHAGAIQKAINSGAGLTAGPGMCGRGVWRILLRAGLVRGSWGNAGANAKDMGPILAAQGFRKDMNACNRPGVVRVYSGNQSGRHFSNRMKGDIFGHIEILGLDRGYHSFYNSNTSISQKMARKYGTSARRPLKACWYKP